MEQNKIIFFMVIYKEDHCKTNTPSHSIFSPDKGSNSNKSLTSWQAANIFSCKIKE